MKYIEICHPKRLNVSLTGWILDEEPALGQRIQRPAVVICPGGGYLYLSPREGDPVALAYAAKGLHAFVLHYSLGKDAAGFMPLQDFEWALGVIRSNAAQWSVDPAQIAACGFSAGGHLALAGALTGKERPNALILCYPAVRFSGKAEEGGSFIIRLLTGNAEITDADASSFDLLPQVGQSAPPLFLFGTAEDPLSRDVLALAQRYADQNLPYELHLFQFGPHGMALAGPETADGSSQVLDGRVATWHALSVGWLFQTFGGLSHTDKTTSRISRYLKELGIEHTPSGTEFA